MSIKFIEEQDLKKMRHSLSHIMAQAILKLYPEAKLAIGPDIDNGFYYDIDLGEQKLGDEDLKKIEKNMKKIMANNQKFEAYSLPVAEAKIKLAGNPYKLELIEELEKAGESEINFYRNVDGSGQEMFDDMCRGPHVASTKEVGAFKLDKIAGAYWRGDSNNVMLQRIYGLAFGTQEELDEYLRLRAEAEKRDHRKLGRELNLFTISPLIGAGLPLMQPKGMIIRKAIEDYLWELHQDKGYDRVWTPHIAKEDLYVTSGHAAKFGDELFRVKGKEENFFMKPMNCPHHMQIYADNQFSYRDLPVRYFEPATVYRDEKSGQLGGLTRVRSITQDDGHLFCRLSQIDQEVSTIVAIIKEFFTTFGLMDGYWVSLSVRGEDKSKYVGEDAAWDQAEAIMEEAAKKNDLNYRRVEGEAAFYGPKLDFMFHDALGREWQLATIQCDFNLPERFDLSCINEKGEKERVVVIHRAISGSLERFMGIMIEHFAGDFPLWLAPVQVKLISVGEKHHDYVHQLASKLRQEKIRVDVDLGSETVGNKIRKSEKEKNPYMLVIGDKEMTEGRFTLRLRGEKDQREISLDELINEIQNKVATRAL